MKVQIKNLESNPFRDMKSYPIEEDKINALINSINETGFWNNILIRRHPEKSDKFQIAYGHHRLLAIQKILGMDEIIDVPIKDIGDENMLRIMANENDSTWGLNVRVDDETVRVAKKFLEKNLEIAKKYIYGLEKGGRISPDGHIGSKIISRFLGKNWYLHRVDRSLERIRLEEEGKISRKALNILPTEGTARSFVQAVKEIKPDLEIQEKVAQAISNADKSEGLTSSSRIQHELLQEKLKKEGIIKEKAKQDKTKDFLEYIEECSSAIKSISGKLIKLIDYKREFDSGFYRQTFERFDFIASARILIARLQKLIEEETNHEKIREINN